MGQFFARTKVVLSGLLLGCLFSGCCAATQLPSGWGFTGRATAWCWYMAGPFVIFPMGALPTHPLAANCVGLGFLSVPLIAAHPIRPSAVTAAVSLVGCALWFAASFVTIAWAVWGA